MVNGFIFGVLVFIYLGSEATVEASTVNFPYLASVQSPGIRGRRHVCNGAIINKNWILTIGSCVYYMDDPRAYRIHVGGEDYFDSDDNTVIQKVFHPLHSINSTDYNLALLRVETPLKFNDRVKSIPIGAITLPARANQVGTLVGWGYSYEKPFAMPELKLNSLECVTLENTKCDADSKGNKLCTRIVVPESPHGLCHGTSGSLLVINNKLVALSSYGVRCPEDSETRFLTPINTGIEKWITATIK